MRIVFTGPCELFTRIEFENLLNKNEFIIQKAVSNKTDMLITNNINSGTSKCRKAKELGIKIITYENFLREYIPEYLI